MTTEKRFYSNTCTNIDGDGETVWTTNPYKSRNIYETRKPDNTVDESCLDAYAEYNDEPMYVIQCRTSELATKICAMLNEHQMEG